MGQHPSKRRPLSLPTRKGGHILVDLGTYTKTAQGSFGFPSLPDGRPDRTREKLRYLFEKAHARTPAPPDLSFVWLVGTGHDPQKCRLTRAINAHHPDPVTVGDRERKPFEERPADPVDRHLFQIDEHGHEAARLLAYDGAVDSPVKK
jgi:hypothetical protein